MIFPDLTPKIAIILINSHWMTIVVLAVAIFQFDNLRKKRSVSLTKLSGIACLKNSCGTPVKNLWLRAITLE